VTWGVQESFGGTIDSTGIYTAPRDAEGTFHVVAISQADPTARGMAAAVVPVPQVAISPAAVTLPPGSAQIFTVTVSGLTHTEVTWRVSESTGGLINGAGFYTAPGAEGLYHVVATSAEGATITATVTISVTTSAVSFTPTGSLQRARGFHTATLLANGKVLVAGGANRGSDKLCPGGISSAELYDPAAGLFASTGVLTTARFAHTATLLKDGKVLVTGGLETHSTVVTWVCPRRRLRKSTIRSLVSSRRPVVWLHLAVGTPQHCSRTGEFLLLAVIRKLGAWLRPRPNCMILARALLPLPEV
jgi:hypothetical protein